MANKLPSALLAAQARITPRFTEAELRERQNPILRTGLANQNYLMVDVKSIKESTKRAVKGYQRVKMTATNATTRVHNFTGNQNDTQEVSLSWGTYTEKFSVYWDSSADNIFNSMVDDIAFGSTECQRIIRERLGAFLLAQLHAGRTQVANTIVRNATFDAATDAFQISNQNQFFAYVRSVLNQHKYLGAADLLVDSVLDPIAKYLANQGNMNGTNSSYQLNSLNIMPHDSLCTDVEISGYTDGGIAIALPANSFAFIPWIPKKYTLGDGDINGVNGKRYVMPDNTGLPLQYAVWAYTEKADGSSNGGTTDDMVTHFQVSVDVAAQVAAMSTANESPIYEFALVG